MTRLTTALTSLHVVFFIKEAEVKKKKKGKNLELDTLPHALLVKKLAKSMFGFSRSEKRFKNMLGLCRKKSHFNERVSCYFPNTSVNCKGYVIQSRITVFTSTYYIYNY